MRVRLYSGPMTPICDTAVVEVRSRGQYEIWVRFADGAEGTVDLTGFLDDPSWEGTLERWRNPEFFDAVKPGGLGVVWSVAHANDISLASDRLYANVRDLTPEEMDPDLYATQVVKAEALDRYRVRLRFADGVEGEVDLADFAGRGVFLRWEQSGGWEDMRISHGTLEWGPNDPTAVIDFCPEMLYSRAAGVPRNKIGTPEFADGDLRSPTT